MLSLPSPLPNFHSFGCYKSKKGKRKKKKNIKRDDRVCICIHIVCKPPKIMEWYSSEHVYILKRANLIWCKATISVRHEFTIVVNFSILFLFLFFCFWFPWPTCRPQMKKCFGTFLSVKVLSGKRDFSDNNTFFFIFIVFEPLQKSNK